MVVVVLLIKAWVFKGMFVGGIVVLLIGVELVKLMGCVGVGVEKQQKNISVEGLLKLTGLLLRRRGVTATCAE